MVEWPGRCGSCWTGWWGRWSVAWWARWLVAWWGRWLVGWWGRWLAAWSALGLGEEDSGVEAVELVSTRFCRTIWSGSKCISGVILNKEIG